VALRKTTAVVTISRPILEINQTTARYNGAMLALVTGSTGFLGRSIVERLREAGHNVRALARDADKARDLAALGVEIALGDITRPASLDAAVRGVDVVFHSAALVTNWAPWAAFIATTVQGTENLLAASVRAKVQRFVHISTTRVYCDRHCRQHIIVTEDAPHGLYGFRNFGHYSRAKVMAEAAVWRAGSQLPVSVVRPAWIYGPGDEVILPSIVKFLRDPYSLWPGRVDGCADPIYVTDVADCAIAVALHPAAVGQAYNASPDRRIGVREFLGLFCERLDIKMPQRSAPKFLASMAAHASEWWATILRRQSAPQITRAGVAVLSEDVRYDSSKAERELGWRSRIELAVGVENAARWLRERHPELLA
jgi:2-alkyl-3-oxoalkanoate reductase